MVLKWIRSVTGGATNEVVQQCANRKARELVQLQARDLAHEALKLRARERSAELDGLVRTGTPHLKREQFKSCVHRKVFEIVSRNFNIKPGGELDEITEEVTDQIIMAADHDPTYRRMFESNSGPGSRDPEPGKP